jgi:uncharacterized repeat protein (TIGR01451 family)
MDKSRSRRIVTIILVIAAVLGLASIGTAYYYYQIRDVTPNDASAAQGCGCYFVDSANGVSSCASADPKMAFEFRAGVVQDNGTCSATCDLTTAATVADTGAESSVIACKVPEFTLTPGCIDIAVENADGERIPNSVDPDEDLTLKATFNVPQNLSTEEGDFYDSFSLLVNGEKSEIDVTEAVKRGTGSDVEYTVSTNVTDLGTADTLTLQAFGSSVVGTDFTSGACLRELTVNQVQAPSCSALDISTIEEDNETRVNELTLQTAGVDDVETVVAKFTVGSSDKVLTTENLASKYLAGTILLDKAFLYNDANFTGDEDFSVLDSETDEIEVAAVLTVNGTEIDSDACTASEEIEGSEPTDNPGEEPNEEDPDEEDPDEPSDGDDTSAFSVAVSAGGLQCVERTSPDNVVTYTITVTNGDSAFEDVASIVNKLPLGFSYVDGSSIINGVAVADNDFVDVEEVGAAEQITWQTDDGWSVDADDDLTVQFQAIVTADALSGDNLNEVVVIPVNTPADPDSVRTEIAVEVAQNCGTPETALLDSTTARLVLAVFIILFGAAFYSTTAGTVLSEKLAGSKATQKIYKGAQMAGWRVTNPKKYFEQKTIDKLEKKKRSSRS